MTTNPQVLSSRILLAPEQAGRQDGTLGRQGDVLLALRLGQHSTFITLTPRGDLLITAPDADRYSLLDGCLHYADCCPAAGSGTPTQSARDFRPQDFEVGQDYR